MYKIWNDQTGTDIATCVSSLMEVRRIAGANSEHITILKRGGFVRINENITVTDLSDTRS